MDIPGMPDDLTDRCTAYLRIGDPSQYFIDYLFKYGYTEYLGRIQLDMALTSSRSKMLKMSVTTKGGLDRWCQAVDEYFDLIEQQHYFELMTHGDWHATPSSERTMTRVGCALHHRRASEQRQQAYTDAVEALREYQSTAERHIAQALNSLRFWNFRRRKFLRSLAPDFQVVIATHHAVAELRRLESMPVFSGAAATS